MIMHESSQPQKPKPCGKRAKTRTALTSKQSVFFKTFEACGYDLDQAIEKSGIRPVLLMRWMDKPAFVSRLQDYLIRLKNIRLVRLSIKLSDMLLCPEQITKTSQIYEAHMNLRQIDSLLTGINYRLEQAADGKRKTLKY